MNKTVCQLLLPSSRSLLAVLLGAILVAPSTLAALSWERTLVQYQAKIGEEVIAFEFPFSNQTDHAVTILSVKPGCDCTTATLDKYRYAPGEKGSVSVVFDGKGLFLLQEKTIQVISDDARAQPTSLSVRVTIPLWLKITPQVLSWPIGSGLTDQEARVTLDPADGLRIVDVATTDPTFRANLKPDADGRTFHIVVTPESTRSARDAGVNLRVESTTLATRTFVVVARVR